MGYKEKYIKMLENQEKELAKQENILASTRNKLTRELESISKKKIDVAKKINEFYKDQAESKFYDNLTDDDEEINGK